MDKLTSYVIASLLLISSLPAFAVDAKIGFVDTIKLMELAPQAKAAFAKIEQEFEPKNKELVAMQKKIKGMEDKLNRDGAVMSEQEQVKRDRDIRSEKRELKRKQDEFREDLNIRRNEEITKLQRTLFAAIEALGKEENYDVILVESGVVFRSSRIDLTEKVLARLK